MIVDSLISSHQVGLLIFSYIIKGKETENWRPQFTCYGFRYLQVEGAVPAGEANPKSLPVISKITGLHTRNSASTVGSFSCSNKLFNDIFSLINWAIKSNMATVITDCPHREKLGWLEVPHLLAILSGIIMTLLPFTARSFRT